MGIFTVDTTAFKADLHKLLNEDNDGIVLQRGVADLVSQHRLTFDPDDLTNKLCIRIRRGSWEDARELVDRLPDRASSAWGVIISWAAKTFGIWVLKVAAITAYMTLVWWACERWLAP